MSHLMDPSKLRTLLPQLRQNLAAMAASRQPSSREPGASVAAVFRWKERERQTLELLFIRRSINERDQWSGQVAFPGGRRQKKTSAAAVAEAGAISSVWETSLETAQRETLEEIGLDLTQPHVQWIGSLPILQTHIRTFHVGTEIFFMDETASTSGAFVPVIQESEIADVLWVDILELFNPIRYQPLAWPVEDMVPLTRKYPQVRRAVKSVLGDLLFGSIYLPRPGHPLPDEDPTPRHKDDFILWGLTMRMVHDIFQIAESPLPMDDVSPRFESKRLGDLILFLQRYPHKALQRGLGVAVAIAAITVVGSRL